jgi:hypothetical protein
MIDNILIELDKLIKVKFHSNLLSFFFILLGGFDSIGLLMKYFLTIGGIKQARASIIS